MRLRHALLGGAAAVAGAALWWRKNPSACPYGQRFWVEAPHPLITRTRQQEMLDHTMRRAGERGLANITPAQSDATSMPYEDGRYDAAYLVTVLGEIPDQDAALRELSRVLKPGGRLVVGELLGDPHYVRLGPLRLRATGAGLSYVHRAGNALGYFARFTKL
jgi:SAM-dependent methyltransferase